VKDAVAPEFTYKKKDIESKKKHRSIDRLFVLLVDFTHYNDNTRGVWGRRRGVHERDNDAWRRKGRTIQGVKGTIISLYQFVVLVHSVKQTIMACQGNRKRVRIITAIHEEVKKFEKKKRKAIEQLVNIKTQSAI
jgi:hypothetical protein